jgi:hypothetical protein
MILAKSKRGRRRPPGSRAAAGALALVAALIAMASAATPASAQLPLPTLSIDDVTIAPEGDIGFQPATFTVTLSSPSTTDVTVSYQTSNGTAVAPADYTSVPVTQLTIPAGATSATVTALVNGDALDEADETFQVVLSTPSTNAAILDAIGIATIVDDDLPPVLRVDDPTVAEGTGTSRSLVFTVTLAPASGRTVTVDYATADATATAGSDYTARSGTLSFSPGVTALIVSIAITTDAVDELDETMLLNLTLPSGSPATIGDAQGEGRITDDDGPTISVNDVTVAEGDSATTGATFTVALSTASVQPVTVSAVTANDTAVAPGDYTALPAQTALTIPAGQTTGTLTVAVAGDVVDEADERFRITLSSPQGGTLADSTGFATITDDDPSPAIRIDDARIAEGSVGSTSVDLKVSLNRPSERAITVSYATQDGTATGGVDYGDAADTLTFAPLQTERTITLPIGADRTVENDETFTVSLSNPVNATLDKAVATITIVDDDLTPANTPALSVDDVEVASEGDSGSRPVTFTVRLAPAPGRTAAVSYATADAGATVPADYAAVSGRLEFAPGETSRTVTTTVRGDTAVEGDESFVLKLSGPVNATIADGSATASIVDDDVGLGVVAVPASIRSSRLLCATRRRCPGLPVRVQVLTRGELVYELAAIAPPRKGAGSATRLISILKTTATVNSARTTRAILRPTPGRRTRRLLVRLRRERAQTLRVRVTFTNRGGDSKTATKRLKLELRR